MFQKKIKSYFVNKYYCPNIQIDLAKTLFKYANTSIDISDGLIADLEKMINRQNLSYKINADEVPISKNLLDLIKIRKLNKLNLISQGDDYQVLFTACPAKARIIRLTSKNLGIKITKIGKITSVSKKSIIADQKGKQILIKNKGYTHLF
jgi:thiamine-monophosphate kinase